jgi:hypothetical protein
MGAMHFFAQLSSYKLESSLQVMKILALLMLKQAGGAKKCIAPHSLSSGVCDMLALQYGCYKTAG